eukprot:scaffold1033_cov171-Amphora_coffeaeformis.AAC.8
MIHSTNANRSPGWRKLQYEYGRVDCGKQKNLNTIKTGLDLDQFCFHIRTTTNSPRGMPNRYIVHKIATLSFAKLVNKYNPK